MKKVAVIGAGPSGLCAIRHCLREGFEVIAIEQDENLGGQWNTTGAVGKNKYGIEAHSSIYEGLETNLPKEIMAYPDFPYGEKIRESFLTPDKVLDYFKLYAEAFELRKFIKFEHHVVNVRPLPNTETWEVTVKDLPNNQFKVFNVDHVFICIGISTPKIAKIEGHEDFKGHIMHSHDYRNTRMFKNKRVLVIGSGPSALDIVMQVGVVAEKIFWVQKIKQSYGADLKFKFPESVTTKSGILTISIPFCTFFYKK